MIREGQIVIFSFPQADQVVGKLRPALVVRNCPGPHDDWLICMISSQVRREIQGVDEVVRDTDSDFTQTGLKRSSVIRTTRLAVVSASILQGAIGSLDDERMHRIHRRLADWILGRLPVPESL